MSTPDAARDSGATTNAAEMLAYAEDYAKEHPDEFAKVIERFREVERNCKGTVESLKAKDAAEAWQGKWEEAAETEFQKRRAAAAVALKSWQFQEAEAVWEAFPTGLHVASIAPKMEAELVRIGEARTGVAKALEDEAKPLLARRGEELSAEEVKAISSLLEKAGNAPEGLPEEATEAVEALKEKLRTHLDDYEAVAASKAQEALNRFWARYEGSIKRREFEEAAKLCENAEADLRGLVVPPSGGSGDSGRDSGATQEEPLKSGTTRNSRTTLGSTTIPAARHILSARRGRMRGACMIRAGTRGNGVRTGMGRIPPTRRGTRQGLQAAGPGFIAAAVGAPSVATAGRRVATTTRRRIATTASAAALR